MKFNLGIVVFFAVLAFFGLFIATSWNSEPVQSVVKPLTGQQK